MLRRLRQLLSPIKIGRLGRTAVYVDWSLPVGLWFFCGAHPWRWAVFVFLVGAHEMGHALLVRRQGFRVHGIYLHGLGGECVWSGESKPRQRQIIAWGGVVAQAFILTAAVLAQPLLGSFPDLEFALIRMNALIIAFNLVPIPPLDGTNAWPLLFPARKKPKPASPAQIQKVVADALNKARSAPE